jgi:hypothetical protein
VTSEVMSFWHGWTPDGKTLAYCGERNGNYDIYTIGIEGGTEKRLTSTEGLDDDPIIRLMENTFILTHTVLGTCKFGECLPMVHNQSS